MGSFPPHYLLSAQQMLKKSDVERMSLIWQGVSTVTLPPPAISITKITILIHKNHV